MHSVRIIYKLLLSRFQCFLFYIKNASVCIAVVNVVPELNNNVLKKVLKIVLKYTLSTYVLST